MKKVSDRIQGVTSGKQNTINSILFKLINVIIYLLFAFLQEFFSGKMNMTEGLVCRWIQMRAFEIDTAVKVPIEKIDASYPL